MSEVVPKKLMSVLETSQMLGVSSRTLFTMARNGELPCIKIGKSVRYDLNDINRYIESKRTKTIQLTPSTC